MPTTASTKPEVQLRATRPIVATIAVVLVEDSVLLVRRANPPDAGRWGLPGGKIEMGESLEAGAVRELFEETGIEGQAKHVLTAVDAFDRDATGALRQHFVLVAVLCQYLAGKPVAQDDALEARWFLVDELEDTDLALSLDVVQIARMAQRAIEAPV